MLNPALPATALIGTAIAALATLAMVRLATRLGFVAPFNPIVPQERPPAALGGGIAIGVGLVLALILADGLGWFSGSARIALAALPALAVGLADDVRAFSPRTKLLHQGIAAAIGVIATFGVPAPDATGWAIFAGTLFAALVLMNAMNFLDVSDGYAASIALICFGGMSWVGGDTGAGAGLAGCCAGFLMLNRPPARIYMGDAGSHFLGMMAALLIAAALRTKPSPATAILSLACFAVPLAELGIVTLIRWRRGISIWRGSPDHSALRLQRAGFSKARAMAIAAAAQLAVILTAMALT